MLFRASLVLLLLLMLLIVGRCQLIPNHYADLQLVSLQQLQAQRLTGQNKPLLGIAFGGGGVRGFMHLGVIKALQEAGVQASVVTGSSAGAIAAVLYASKLQYPTLQASVNALDEWDLVDPIFSRAGLINGQALAAWVARVVDNKTLEQLPLSVGVTVTDLHANRSLLAIAGDSGRAVQASASIPGVFAPVQAGEHSLTDGGALSLVPVRYARALGAQWVLAIDVYCAAPQPIENNSVNTLLAVFRLQSCQLSAAEAAEADLLLQPVFEPKSFRNFDSRADAIEAGYRAMRAAMPQLQQILVQD